MTMTSERRSFQASSGVRPMVAWREPLERVRMRSGSAPSSTR